MCKYCTCIVLTTCRTLEVTPHLHLLLEYDLFLDSDREKSVIMLGVDMRNIFRPDPRTA